MIICFTEDTIGDLYELILDNFVKLANNSNSLCIVKKLITYAKKETTISRTIEILLQNFSVLIQNSYGNYAIQTAFETWSNEFTEPLYKQLYSQFHQLSMSKYSSNVVEKCLERGGDELLQKFIEEICQKSKLLGKHIPAHTLDLMKNSFGNYVVQKALKLATGFLKVKLTNNIKKNMEKLTDKKLVAKWKSILLNVSNANLTLNPMGGKNNGFNDSFGSNNLNNSFGSIGSNNSFHSTSTQPVNNSFTNQMIFTGQQPAFNRIYPRSGGTSPTNLTYRFPSPNFNMFNINSINKKNS
jgi:hypothetical protein